MHYFRKQDALNAHSSEDKIDVDHMSILKSDFLEDSLRFFSSTKH